MNKFYITTAIDYVNGNPHMGHALEKIQADAIARFRRSQGDEVYFLTGTDEHGAKIARAAAAAGKATEEFVDEISEKFKELLPVFNLSCDNFIRTSDRKTHWPVAQEIWNRLASAGDLYKKTYKGLYCVGHEAFVTQKDLVDGKCADHKKEPELISEENWFFKLSKYSKEIELRITNNELRIVPETRKNEILSLLKDGLEDISFSRPAKDLSWGVPVPGDPTQTMYVWADALSNYISGLSNSASQSLVSWENHPADVHLVGKDILRFHAAIWPAMLLSAKLKLPEAIFVHGHILVGGEKMSKTVGNVVDPFELVKKYGIDPVRYFLLREIPSGEDGDFTYEKFEERYNGDLANGLGNFAARVLTLAERDTNLQITSSDAIGFGRRSSESAKIEKNVDLKIQDTKNQVSRKIQEFKLNEALEALWALIHFGDQYVNEKKPWDKSLSAEQKANAIYNALVILDNVAALLLPFLPDTSEKITQGLHWEGNKLSVKKIENLFPRL